MAWGNPCASERKRVRAEERAQRKSAGQSLNLSPKLKSLRSTSI